MGLLIKENGEKKINIDGTSIELPEIYLRVEFTAKMDGKTIEVALYPFASRDMFVDKKTIYTDVPVSNLWIVLEEGQDQNIKTVLVQLAKYYSEELGYIAEITGIEN